MKFDLARTAMAALFLATLPCAAQSTPATPQEQPHQGKVIFSRSTDENGQTTTTTPIAQPTAATKVPVAADDAERKAVTFTAFDLDVHLHPADQQIAVRALVTVRNDSKAPLARIPLQISSSLNWESIRLTASEGPTKPLDFPVATLNSDADHSGKLHEALISLDKPLAPGQSLQFDAMYSGPIALSAQRLLAVGAPDEVALRSDWDQISPSFTGLRGFGNVVWYPVSSVPVMLGDGARLFDEMGEHKLRLSGARFRLRLAVEFPHGQAPTVALINGFSVPLAVAESSGALDQSQEVDGVATADSGSTTLGFGTPSLFVAIRTPHPGANLTAWTLPDNNVSVDFWTTAASAVTPFLQGWLGQKPHSQLALLDLPDPGDASFETGALLAAPLRELGPTVNPKGLDGILVHALTHAWIASPKLSQPPPDWLNEGVATFMGTLWSEKRHGRDGALGMLEADRAALALAEPSSPGESAGQPLAQAISPVYYRTKAAYVLWMLRDLAGDKALVTALRADISATNAPATSTPALSKPAPRSPIEKLLEETGTNPETSTETNPGTSPDLSWFFADWVDADKGLPDLSIGGVFTTAASAGNWLVSMDLANAGYAQAEVPVTVRSGSGADLVSVTQRVRIPARGKVTAHIIIQSKPSEVQVNDGTVPETQASIHITKLDDPALTPSSSNQTAP
jgi:hypothetical protein